SVKDTPVDLRIVAATHRKLDTKVKEGTFREDLFYRLNTFTLSVPPLRERPSEIPLLAARFVAEECRLAGRAPATLSDEVIQVFLSYPWPGNVRERGSAFRGAVVLCDSEITPVHLPPEIAPPAPTDGAQAPDLTLKDQVRNVERERILDALAAAKGNQTKAAQILKIARRTLISKMIAMGIERPRVRRPKPTLPN